MAKNKRSPAANRRTQIRRALKVVNPELSSVQIEEECQYQMQPQGWMKWLQRHPTLDKAQKRALTKNTKYLRLNQFLHKGPNANIMNCAQSIIEASENITKVTRRPLYYCYENYGITDVVGKPMMEIGIKARIKQKLKLRRNQSKSANTTGLAWSHVPN